MHMIARSSLNKDQKTMRGTPYLGESNDNYSGGDSPTLHCVPELQAGARHIRGILLLLIGQA